MRFLVVVALVARLVAAQQNASVDSDLPAALPAPTNTTLPTTVATPANVTDAVTDAVTRTVNATVNATAPADAALPTAAPAPTAATTANGKCQRTCVRKEWRSLSPQERQAYLNAVRRLQSIPAGANPAAAAAQPATPAAAKATPPAAKATSPAAKATPAAAKAADAAPRNPRLQARQATNADQDAPLNGPSEYDRLVQLHMTDSPFAHGTDYFLPWHRAYLREFELALQRIDPSVCGVYWQWSLDSQAPEYSPLLTPDYYGGNGQGADNCVQDGAFAGWRPAYPEPHCLRRVYAQDGTLGSFHSTEAVNRAISTIKDYPTFRRQIEGVLHPTPHVNFGGDMSTMNSPNDPLFWLHHTYVDFMWSRFQQRNGFDFSAKADTALASLATYRAADVMDERQLCYEYAELTDKDLGDSTAVPPPPPPSKTPRGPRPKTDPLPELTTVKPLPVDLPDTERYSSRDRSNLAALRYADSTPREWCERNNIPYDDVVTFEQEYRTVCTQLNQIKGYVSPCALLKRPTLQARIIQARKVTQFYVDVPDLGRVEIGYKPEVAQADPYEAVANVNQRVYTCSPDVERPAEEFRATVQKLIGPSAFSGAGNPIPIDDMDSVQESAATPALAVSAGVVMAAVSGVAVALALF